MKVIMKANTNINSYTNKRVLRIRCNQPVYLLLHYLMSKFLVIWQ